MRKVRVAPKGMGLNDFVAEEEGFFADEGIQVEWDIKTFRGTQSSWKDLDYKSRPQDQPYAEGDKSLIQCACVWGSISNASAGMGRFVPDCYGVSPWAIFVRPDSKILIDSDDARGVHGTVGLRRERAVVDALRDEVARHRLVDEAGNEHRLGANCTKISRDFLGELLLQAQAEEMG